MKEYQTQRHQMSSSGCWLQKKLEKPTIDIAGDILTAVSAFSGLEGIHPEMHLLFKRVYHTIGNCIPWPEGGNLGGRPWKNGGSPDNYFRKPNICYNLMNKSSEPYDTKCVSCRINNQKKLGEMGFSSIQYWIDEIWKGKEWKDFVEINHLQDMVDDDLKPKPFGLCGQEIKPEDLKKVYMDNIKMIICRGYRITHNGELDSTIINEILHEICKQLK